MATPEPTVQDYVQALTDKSIYESWSDVYKKQFDYAKAKANKTMMEGLVSGAVTDYQTDFAKGLEEAQRLYLAPAIEPGFGPVSERTEQPLKLFGMVGPDVPDAPPFTEPPSPLRGEPTLATALGMQQAIPKPRSGTKLATDFRFDEKAYEDSMVAGGLEPEKAKLSAKAFGAAATALAESNPQLSENQILNEVQRALGDLGDVGTKTVPLERSSVLPSVSAGGTKDPLISALSQQVEDIEIPDYDFAQRAFIKSYTDQAVQQDVDKNTRVLNNLALDYVAVTYEDQGKKRRVFIPKEVAQYIQDKPQALANTIYSDTVDAQIRGGKISSPTNMLPDDKRRSTTDSRALAQVQAIKKYDADAWYLDQDKRSAVLADPEAFVEQGIFTSDAQIGGTRETVAGYLLRGALSPLNAIAGGIVDLTSGEDLKEIKRQYRKDTQALYENNPVLANIALNKGFTGEGVEVAEALQLEGLPYYIVIGGSFAGDVLDPTLAVTGGAIKGTKAAKTFYGAQKALGAGKDVKGALKAGSQVLAKEVADDFNLIAPFVPKKVKDATPFSDTLATGINRSLQDGRIAEQVKDYARFTDQASQMAPGAPKSAFRNAIDEAMEANPNADFNEVVKQVKRESVGANTEALKLLEEYDNRSRMLELMYRTDGNVNAVKQAMGQDFDSTFLTSVAKRVGKAPEDLGILDLSRIGDSLTKAVARSMLFELVPEAANIKGITSITTKTYAHPESVDKILEAAAQSDNGKDLINIATSSRYSQGISPLKGRTGLLPSQSGMLRPKLVDNIVLNEADRDKVLSIAQDLADKGQISPNKLAELESTLESARRFGDVTAYNMSTEDFRFLIDRNVDEVASTMEGSVKTSDIERLRERRVVDTKFRGPEGDVPVEVEVKGELLPQARQLLEPPETRFNKYDPDTITGMVANAFTDSAQWLGQKVLGLLPSKTLKSLNKKPEYISTATVSQQKLINGIQAKNGALDNALRTDIRSLGNAEVRELYGITDEVYASMNELDKLGAIIVGPPSRGAELGDEFFGFATVGALDEFSRQNAISEAMDWGLRRLFFSADPVEILTDRASGFNLLFSNRILNDEGNKVLSRYIKEASQRAMARPENYWEIFTDLSKQYEELITVGIRKEGPSGFTFDGFQAPARQVDPVTYVSALRPDVTIPSITKITPEELQSLRPEITIGQYYFARSRDNINEAFQKYVDEDFGDIRSEYVELWESTKLRDFIRNEDEFVQLVNQTLDYMITRVYDPDTPISQIKYDVLINWMYQANRSFVDPATQIGSIFPDAMMQQLTRYMGTDNHVFGYRDIYALAPQNEEFGNFLTAVQPIIDRMYGDTFSIMRRNGIAPGINTSVNQVKRNWTELMQDDQLARLYFGEKQYDILKQQLFEGRNSLLTAQLDTILREESATKKGWLAVRKFMNFANSLRYTALLGMRPRFHGVNVLTANTITYQTVGRFQGNVKDGVDIAFRANAPGDAKYFDIAVIGPTGKPYTYGELNRTIREGGLRSEYEFINTTLSDDQLIAELTKGMPKSKKQAAYDGYKLIEGSLGRFTTQEDMIFRGMIMKSALEEGRSLDEATALARRSLFDYNDMTEFEKGLASSIFIFYGFQRQAVASFVKSLYDAKQLRRYINILKFERGTEILTSELMGEDYKDLIYAPGYMKNNRIATRAAVGKENDWYLTSPPIPAIDSMIMTTQIFRGHFLDMARKAINPNVRFLTGLEDPFAKSNKIPAEYINALEAFGFETEDIPSVLETITGGKIDTRAASGERGGVSGYMYYMNPKQQKAWNDYVANFLWEGHKFLSLDTPAKDWIKTFGGIEGTSWQQTRPLLLPAAAVGAVTPMKGMSPQQVEAAQLRTRRFEIADEIRRARSGERAAEEQLIKKSME